MTTSLRQAMAPTDIEHACVSTVAAGVAVYFILSAATILELNNLNSLWRKLAEPRIWRRIYIERLGEPLIYNIAAMLVAAFGTTRQKIAYDLILRHPYAFCIQEAADLAKSHGIAKLTLIEFGVASGAGLLNLCLIADKVAKETGVQFEIVGFDSGEGMPPPRDYRDHPEKYFTGDFPVTDKAALHAKLPSNARIIYGDIKKTLADFNAQVKAPIGVVCVDVDYYWSARESLDVLLFEPHQYLPRVYMYFDDVQDIDDNKFCGELCAIEEFNADPSHPLRRLAPANFLSELRIFKRAIWHKQIYLAHVFDHEFRSPQYIQRHRKGVSVLTNPYI
jgi:hypothetical protein